MPLIALVPMTEQSEAELIQTPNALTGTPQTQIGRQTARTTDLNADLKAVLIEPVRLSVMTLSWADQDSLFIKGTSNGGEAVRGMLNDRVFIANHDENFSPFLSDYTCIIKTVLSKSNYNQLPNSLSSSMHSLHYIQDFLLNDHLLLTTFKKL